MSIFYFTNENIDLALSRPHFLNEITSGPDLGEVFLTADAQISRAFFSAVNRATVHSRKINNGFMCITQTLGGLCNTWIKTMCQGVSLPRDLNRLNLAN
jgi:hypothetical protein